MGWEKRGKNEYYYQKIREDDKVFSKYIGHNSRAYDLASAIKRKTLLKDEMDTICEFGRDLSNSISLIMKATFIAEGLFSHRGEWRRKKR